VRNCLEGPGGLFFDHISFDGKIDETTWSYNQGAMIGAGVLLAEATGDERPLAQAQEVAAAALADGRYRTDPAEFTAIFFHDLALLDAARPRPEYREALEGYVDSRWRSRAGSGLFADRQGRETLIEQAGVVRLLAELAAA
jgi:hypothetical protein